MTSPLASGRAPDGMWRAVGGEAVGLRDQAAPTRCPGFTGRIVGTETGLKPPQVLFSSTARTPASPSPSLSGPAASPANPAVTALCLLPLYGGLKGFVGRLVDRESTVLCARVGGFALWQVRDGQDELEAAEALMRVVLRVQSLRLPGMNNILTEDPHHVATTT